MAPSERTRVLICNGLSVPSADRDRDYSASPPLVALISATCLLAVDCAFTSQMTDSLR
jgi:hypothetical protein